MNGLKLFCSIFTLKYECQPFVLDEERIVVEGGAYGIFQDNLHSTGVLWKEFGHIIRFAVHNHPAVLLGAVLGDLLPRQRHVWNYE